MNKIKPPGLFEKFFQWYCRKGLQESILGDLEEKFEEDLENYGEGKARRRFAWTVIRFFRPGIIKSFEGNQRLNHYGMLKNYFKVGLRNILKYKTFSFINIFGLAVAMAVSLLVILMLADQRETDQFHQNKDHIFRAVTQMTNSSKANASSPMPLAGEMETNYPIIKNATQLVRGVGGDILYADGEQSKFAEVRGFFADQDFFEVFSFELVEGDRQSALTRPNSILITSEVAYKLFNDRDPIGKTVTFLGRGLDHIHIDLGTETGQKSEDWGSFIITGVIDAGAYKTHLKFDALISASSLPRLYKEGKARDHSGDWDNHSHSFTYFLLNEQTGKVDLQAALDEITEKEEKLDGKKLIAQNLDDIVLGDFLGNPISLRLPVQAYYFLGFLALVVLLSAALNYTNLSIARALSRAKEIGVRKVNGATRKNLIFQFLVESVLTAFLALVLANVLLFFLKPAFNSLWVISHLDLDLAGNLKVYLIFLGFTLLVGVLAGLYPSFVLSRFSPTRVLKSLGSPKSGRIGLRAVLNVSQFVFTFFFIVTSILITRQFRHFVDFDYGMDVSNVVNIPLQGNDHELLMTELSTVPGVENVSACQLIPAMPNSYGRAIHLPDDEFIKIEFQSIHPNLLETLDLVLLAGRNLDPRSDNQQSILVNEYTVKALGYESPSELLGQPINISGFEAPFQIVGVIRDFKFQSPISGEGDKPLVYWNNPPDYSYLNVKVASQDRQKTIQMLEAKWKEVDPLHPMSYSIYNESLARANFWLGDLASVVGFIAFLAIVISCLGLLGMAIYTTERRVKEVGIRKVLGASAAELALLLGKSFLRLLMIAVLIAAPLSYFVNNLWIENIPNRISFGYGTIIVAAIFLLIIGVFTIGFQVFSVSKRNPVDSLRFE